jgi:hypothetical protein
MNYKHDTITIEQPVPGRYQITGFQAGSVYVPDVGWLASPQIVDLAMTPDLADALRAVLDDFQPPIEPEPESEADGFESAPKRRGRPAKAKTETEPEPEQEGGAE